MNYVVDYMLKEFYLSKSKRTWKGYWFEVFRRKQKFRPYDHLILVDSGSPQRYQSSKKRKEPTTDFSEKYVLNGSTEDHLND